MKRILLLAAMAAICVGGLRAQSASAPRMVIIDQDAAGPGGSDQMAMMVLLHLDLNPMLLLMHVHLALGVRTEIRRRLVMRVC